MVGIAEKVDGVVAAAVLGRSGGTSRVWLPPRLSSGQLDQTDPGYFLFRCSDLKHPSICSVCCLDFPWPGNVRTPFSDGETATHFPGNDHHCVVLQVRPAIVSTAFFSTGNY